MQSSRIPFTFTGPTYTTGMLVEFRPARIPAEIRALAAFDSKVFHGSDRFPTSAWREYESHWMLVDGRKVGCCAFERDVDFTSDRREDGVNLALAGSLYIASTAIHPRYQGQGFGTLMKAWQIAYARHNGFHRIVTNTRKRNTRMVALNRRFGFHVLHTTRGYYSAPDDATVVMELCLPRRAG